MPISRSEAPYPEIRLGVLKQVVAQSFDILPRRQNVDRVVLPVESSFVPFIHQVLQEWRIAVENIRILVPEECIVLSICQIRSDGLDHPNDCEAKAMLNPVAHAPC